MGHIKAKILKRGGGWGGGDGLHVIEVTELLGSKRRYSSIAIRVSAYSALCSSKPQNVCCDRVAVMVTAGPAFLGLASIRFYVLYCYESKSWLVTNEVIHAHDQKFQRILDMRGIYNSYTTVYCY